MGRMIRKYWMVLRMGLLVLYVRGMLRALSLPRVLAMLEPRSAEEHRREAIEDLLYYVDRWLQLFPYNLKGNCFPRSLSLYRLARRAGYPVTFHCGVRKVEGGLDGHAWLLCDDRAFHESDEHWRAFAVTFSYPSARLSTERHKTAS